MKISSRAKAKAKAKVNASRYIVKILTPSEELSNIGRSQEPTRFFLSSFRAEEEPRLSTQRWIIQRRFITAFWIKAAVDRIFLHGTEFHLLQVLLSHCNCFACCPGSGSGLVWLGLVLPGLVWSCQAWSDLACHTMRWEFTLTVRKTTMVCG